MASHLFLVDTALNYVSGAVALLVSYYAYRYNRLLRSGGLVYLSFGFMLLGVGLVCEASVHLLSAVYTRHLRIFIEASAVYLVLQVAAYLVIALGYAHEAYRRASVGLGSTGILVAAGVRRPPILLLPYGFSVSAELLSVVLLAVVTYQSILVYSTTRNQFAAMVLGAFLSVTVGQGVMMGATITLSTVVFELGELIRFLGFLILLLFLLRSGGSGPS